MPAFAKANSGKITLSQASGGINYTALVGLELSLGSLSTNEVVTFELLSSTTGQVAVGTIIYTGTGLSGNAYETINLFDGAPLTQANFTINYTDPIAGQTFDTLNLTTGTDTYKVADIAVITAEDGFDQTLTITAGVSDGDLSTDSSTFDVTFDGNGGVEGTSASEVIAGGDGSDILTGGDGSDIFIWNAGETGTDTVTDFTLDVPAAGTTPIVEGDVLNLSDLLSGEESLDHTDNSTLASGLTNYLTITSDGTSTTIVADHDGLGVGAADQTIILSNIDLLDGVTTTVQAIENLLDNGNLIVD